jgi:hypothetical protein
VEAILHSWDVNGYGRRNSRMDGNNGG